MGWAGIRGEWARFIRVRVTSPWGCVCVQDHEVRSTDMTFNLCWGNDIHLHCAGQMLHILLEFLPESPSTSQLHKALQCSRYWFRNITTSLKDDLNVWQVTCYCCISRWGTFHATGKSFIKHGKKGLEHHFNNILCWHTNNMSFSRHRFSLSPAHDTQTHKLSLSEADRHMKSERDGHVWCVLVPSPPAARPTGASAAGSSITHTHTHTDRNCTHNLWDQSIKSNFK